MRYLIFVSTLCVMLFVVMLFTLHYDSGADQTSTPATQPATQPTTAPATLPSTQPSASAQFGTRELRAKLLGGWQMPIPIEQYANVPASVDLGDDTLYRFYSVRQLTASRRTRVVS